MLTRGLQIAHDQRRKDLEASQEELSNLSASTSEQEASTRLLSDRVRLYLSLHLDSTAFINYTDNGTRCGDEACEGMFADDPYV